MTSLLVLALAMLPLAQAIPPPDAQLSVVRVWDISWRDAFDAEGRVQRIPVLAPGGDVTRPAGRVRLLANTERAIFTHVYVRESPGNWKLLSSTLVRKTP